MDKRFWFLTLLFFSLVAGAFFYTAQPVYLFVFVAVAPLLTGYIAIMARFFSKRLSMRAAAHVWAVLLLVMVGGEGWAHYSNSKAADVANGLLPFAVHSFQRWKQPTDPNAIKQLSALGGAQTASVSNREILDELATVIVQERCTAYAHNRAAEDTGWSGVLRSDQLSSAEKVREGKLAVANYRKIMWERIDGFKKSNEDGQALIRRESGNEKDQAMRQFVSAENMIIAAQSEEMVMKEPELKTIDQLLDIPLQAFKRSPDSLHGATYTPAEVARWRMSFAGLQAEESVYKKKWDEISYEMSYADHQLDQLVRPDPSSLPRDMKCPGAMFR